MFLWSLRRILCPRSLCRYEVSQVVDPRVPPAPPPPQPYSRGTGASLQAAQCGVWELDVKPPPLSVRNEKERNEGCGSAWREGVLPHRALRALPTSVLAAAFPTQQVPVVEDIDKEQLGDPYANAEYAKEIFDYMREREVGDERCLPGECCVGWEGSFWEGTP